MKSKRWVVALVVAYGFCTGSAVFTAPVLADEDRKSVGEQVADDVKKDVKKKSKEKLKKKLKEGDKKDEDKGDGK